MFKPALARGEIQCIGATTVDEYRKYIEKDGALERRFQKIMIEPTSIKETIEILQNIKNKYEDHHNVKYTDEAIEACVKLTDRYINDRNLPDKAIDAMDEAGSRIHITNMDVPKEIIELEDQLEIVREKKNSVVKNQKYEEAARLRDDEKKLEKKLLNQQEKWENDLKKKRELVTDLNINEVVSLISGIPLKKIDNTNNNKSVKFDLENKLKEKIIGQNDAIDVVVNAIQRNQTGLKDPNKPIGSFIFLGQTGVGKTQLAKTLGEELFNRKDSIVRLDMSEYMEKFSVSRLIGAPPGYVGYDEGGQLSEKIRRKPYSILLLDEVEKAHPDVFNMMLQVLDDGFLTDSVGRKVDFKNTVIIMTSNVGTRKLKDFGTGVGFDTEFRKKEKNKLSTEILKKSLGKKFSPEFLNRIDEIVVFNELEKKEIQSIVKIEINKFIKRLAEIDYKIKIDSKAINFIAQKGYNKEFGARPVKRAIQKYIENEIAKRIVNNEFKKNYKINITHKKNDSFLDFVVSS
jgi:ATP-dependent Clp protease ATP-binding subunit ClpC